MANELKPAEALLNIITAAKLPPAQEVAAVDLAKRAIQYADLWRRMGEPTLPVNAAVAAIAGALAGLLSVMNSPDPTEALETLLEALPVTPKPKRNGKSH